jgi:hypothetical protein
LIYSVQEFFSYNMNIRNKLKCLSLTSLSSLVQCLRVRSGAYTRVEHLQVASLGQARTFRQTLGCHGKHSSLLQTHNLVSYNPPPPQFRILNIRELRPLKCQVTQVSTQTYITAHNQTTGALLLSSTLMP